MNTNHSPDATAQPMDQLIARAAFTWLRENCLIGDSVAQQELTLSHDLVQPSMQWVAITRQILDAYALDRDDEVREGLIVHLLNSLQPAVPSFAQREEYAAWREYSRYEFRRPYLGGDAIPQELETYVTARVYEWARRPYYFYTPPCGAIVQSAGFGKSRLLRELALRTKDDPQGRMRVLYTCVRPDSIKFTSPKYPEATVHLRDYFFSPSVDTDDGGELENKIVRLYEYAIAHWETVGHEWFALFEDQSDATIRQRLEDYDVEVQNAGHCTDSTRVVVLAIDDARYLMGTVRSAVNRRLGDIRTALMSASTRIHRKYGKCSSVFAVMVDSDPDIMGPSNGMNAGRFDVSSLGLPRFPNNLLEPFVLTQTMDVRFNAAAKRSLSTSPPGYHQLVAIDFKTAWPTLASLGRPLWGRTKRGSFWNVLEDPDTTIQLAADMLLRGLTAKESTSFSEESLFGVASVLCRLGVRPTAWSPLASRAVADLSAIVLYTKGEHDQSAISFSSDPVLTFGAARVWYQSAADNDAHSRLSEHILPEFRKLLLQDVVDTGGVGELVSRLLLLLAMDATGVVVGTSDPEYNPREYAGALYPLTAFLSVLYGDGELVVRDHFGTNVTAWLGDQLKASLTKWGGWTIGCSHFIQLTVVPDKRMLWEMIKRRAGGIFPRNQKGVDLVIPISRGLVVSMVIVKVKNCEDGDPAYPDSASTAMRPSLVFANELGEMSPTEVVSIYMNLRSRKRAAREVFYLAVPGGQTDNEDPAPSFTLCCTGLEAWSASRETNQGSGDMVVSSTSVVSDAIVSELEKMLCSQCEPLSLLKVVTRHNDNSATRDDMTQSIVPYAVVSELLKWPEAPSTTERVRDPVKRKRQVLQPSRPDGEDYGEHKKASTDAAMIQYKALKKPRTGQD